MSLVKVLFVSALILAGTTRSADAQGMTCEAWNSWAENVAGLYAAQAMAVLNCDASRAESLEAELADKLSSLAIPDRTGCFFQGLIVGYFSGIIDGYRVCSSRDPSFARLPFRSIAFITSSVAVALFDAFGGVVPPPNVVRRVFRAADSLLNSLPRLRFPDNFECDAILNERVVNSLGTSPEIEDYIRAVSLNICLRDL